MGQDVAVLQYRLKELGLMWTMLTDVTAEYRICRKAFEAYHMLPVDGEADMEMLQRLNQYYEKKPHKAELGNQPHNTKIHGVCQ